MSRIRKGPSPKNKVINDIQHHRVAYSSVSLSASSRKKKETKFKVDNKTNIIILIVLNFMHE